MAGLELFGSMPTMFIEGLGVGFVALNAHSGKILFANEWSVRALGYQSAELTADDRGFLRLLHPDERRIQAEFWVNCVAGRIGRMRFEPRFLHKSGKIVRLRTTQTAIRHPQTGQVEWISCALDEATQADMPAQDVAGEAGAATIWRWSPANDRSGAPAKYEVLLGSQRNLPDTNALPLAHDLHADDAPAVQAALRRAINGVASHLEYRRVDGNGTIAWIRELVSPLQDAEGQTVLIGITTDITSTKHKRRDRQSREIAAFIKDIENRWDSPLVITDVARLHNVSLRSLQKHFSAAGTTPLEFLKRIRLTHARSMLSNPKKTTTVTKVCAKCGFGNLGHFAKYYRNEFGELPSETLVRRHPAQSAATQAAVGLS